MCSNGCQFQNYKDVFMNLKSSWALKELKVVDSVPRWIDDNWFSTGGLGGKLWKFLEMGQIKTLG